MSRAAFYSHAPSPVALLVTILISDIDPALTASLTTMNEPGADYVSGWRKVYLDLLRHAQGFGDIYRVSIAQQSSVCSSLVSYFETTTRPTIETIISHLEGPPPTPLWVRIAVSQQAHGMMSVVRAWVESGFIGSPEAVVDTYFTVAPPWQLARPDEDGAISLSRKPFHST